MSKRHKLLPTRTSFFISDAGKIESDKEFSMKLLDSCFIADDTQVKVVWVHAVIFAEYLLHFFCNIIQ